METVAAVIVTYNRKKLLLQAITAIKKQTRPVDALFIIDNQSDDGTPEALYQQQIIGYLPEVNPEQNRHYKNTLRLENGKNIFIHYVRKFENDGGAGGFYEGLKSGEAGNYDWLWLMDDDGVPKPRCLEYQMEHAHHFDLIGPLVLCNKDTLSFNGFFGIRSKKILLNTYKDLINNDLHPFNGTLIHVNRVIKTIGYVKKELFIWGDEYDYLLRAKKFGLRIGTVLKAHFKHPEEKKSRKKILNRYYIFIIENNFRRYIYIRNHIYLIKKYSSKLSLLKWLIIYSFYFLFVKGSIKQFIQFLRAVYDGLTKNFDRVKKMIR